MPHPNVIDPDRLRRRLRAVERDAAAALDETLLVVRAPGRVNLIGEHTDYNDGFVMPAAIGLEIRLAVLPTVDRRVVITLDDSGETMTFDLDAIGPATGTWMDYVAGTAWALAAAGRPMTGFHGILASNLPRGAGLSSSAALEMAAALALLGPAAAGPPEARALAGRHAENAYVGVQSGVMDQFASASGVADHAILLDCRSLDWRPVPLPLREFALVVCHSGSSRRLDTSAYNERRAECDRAVAAIARLHPAVTSLREVDSVMLAAATDRMDEVAARRARHVVEENIRVLETERAFATGDLDAVGRLFAASHASLRDLFEVSSPELDTLVDIATATDGVVAARLTGAGFGGSTINLVRRDRVGAFRAIVELDYPARTGLRPKVFEVDAVDGAGFMDASPATSR
ncbi:MAG TPA: galactokinase [Candidatus Limnocylindrales bacterium]|nr:galactokinase [Candidatus Limnocylindrales bacterium]